MFYTMPANFKLCPTHFSRGGEKFCSGASPSCARLVTGLISITNTGNANVAYAFERLKLCAHGMRPLRVSGAWV